MFPYPVGLLAGKTFCKVAFFCTLINLLHGFSFMDEHLTERFDMICHGTDNRTDTLGRLCSQTTMRAIIYSSIVLSKLVCN